MKNVFRPVAFTALISALLVAPVWAEDAPVATQEQTRSRIQERVNQADVEQAQRTEQQNRMENRQENRSGNQSDTAEQRRQSLEQRLNEGGSGSQQQGQGGGNGKGKGNGGGGQMGGSRMGGGAGAARGLGSGTPGPWGGRHRPPPALCRQPGEAGSGGGAAPAAGSPSPRRCRPGVWRWAAGGDHHQGCGQMPGDRRPPRLGTGSRCGAGGRRLDRTVGSDWQTEIIFSLWPINFRFR